MEFILRTAGPTPDLATIEGEIAAIDPAVLLDLDANGQDVRISTSVTAQELLDCLHTAGVSARADNITQLPSVCCGGCGG